MTYISVVAYNREILVIDDMNVFTAFFCYAKRQKMGLATPVKPAAEETGDGDRPAPGRVEDCVDADLLPAANIGFRNEM